MKERKEAKGNGEGGQAKSGLKAQDALPLNGNPTSPVRKDAGLDPIPAHLI